MDIRSIAPNFAVSPQIAPADVGAAVAGGYRIIVSCRPDHEAADQPTSKELSDAAKVQQSTYHAIAISAVELISQSQIQQFRALMKSETQPILGFCRTGTRAAMLWALAVVNDLGVDNVISAANAAGYDLSGYRSMLEERRG